MRDAIHALNTDAMIDRLAPVELGHQSRLLGQVLRRRVGEQLLTQPELGRGTETDSMDGDTQTGRPSRR